MIWRSLEKADVPICFALHPRGVGAGLTGNSKAQDAWLDLVTLPAFHGVVIEQKLGTERHVTGIGAAVFVSDEFVAAQLVNPCPGLNHRLIASFSTNRATILSESRIAADNAGAGLNVVVLFGRWTQHVTSQADIVEVQQHLAASFQRLHVGYRFRRIIIDLVDEKDVAFSVAARVFDLVPYPKAPSLALGIVTAQSVRAIPGSVLAPLFDPGEPILGLRLNDQKLLGRALSGATNEDLAEQLQLSVGAVKKRFEEIFAAISDSETELGFRLLALSSNGHRRGRQKRHVIFEYLRHHPEELRPYARTAADS